jgi:hypothetical protein
MRSYNYNMHQFLTKRLAIAWIAMLSVLFGALAPAISHAMAAPAYASSSEEVQVCTMEGMKVIVIAGTSSGKPDKPMPDHMSKHCVCCPAHGVSFMPSPLGFAFPVLSQTSVRPLLFYRAPTPLFAWTSPSPRGPPSLI